jgi:hypothetical protein
VDLLRLAELPLFGGPAGLPMPPLCEQLLDQQECQHHDQSVAALLLRDLL